MTKLYLSNDAVKYRLAGSYIFFWKKEKKFDTLSQA